MIQHAPKPVHIVNIKILKLYTCCVGKTPVHRLKLDALTCLTSGSKVCSMLRVLISKQSKFEVPNAAIFYTLLSISV